MLQIARRGAALHCKEALFSLGDKPELRFQEATAALKSLGESTTIGYLTKMCALVLQETGPLPHPNPGTISRAETRALRRWSPSMGSLLENELEPASA